jgi:hypothetical protein
VVAGTPSSWPSRIVREVRAWLLLLLAGLAVASGACVPHEQAPFGTPSQAEWTLARGRLAELRASQPSHPYVEVVHVYVRDPRTGRTFQGRGAVAVDPHRAMRMVLVGPGGATALDAWTTRDRWRFALPALDRVQRGSVSDDALPVGFFRWWFLAPFDGRLLTARARPGSTLFVLRQGSATITMLFETAGDSARAGLAQRREGGGLDRLAWLGRGLVPAGGDRALYEQPRTGLRVEVDIESISGDPPDPEDFQDPDGTSAASGGGVVERNAKGTQP